MTRQRLGEYLNHCLLGGLGIFAILTLSSVIPVTKKVGILMFSTGILALAVIGVLTDQVGIKGGSINKTDSPRRFWGMVLFYLVVAVGMLFAAFFFRQDLD